jgi:UDPglucose 6-dehydrogenase
MMELKIGIIGLGFVGSAVKAAYESCVANVEFFLMDTDTSKGYCDSYEDLLKCDAVFICVPSPQKEDGSCDTSILEEILPAFKEYVGVVVSKTTAPPDVYERLSKEYPNLVHAPEFLTAANATADYLNSEFVIIGASHKLYGREAARIITLPLFGLTRHYFCTLAEASLIKYTINTYLATKVIFMNEIKKVAEASNIDYNVLIELVTNDYRIGSSHMQVPGPDGLFGFGGACFPKDTSALLSYAKSLGVEMSVLQAAVDKNNKVRIE